MKQFDHTTTAAPAEAFKFAAPSGACKFAATKDGGDGGKSKPVTILARTGEPVDHYYFGRIVHDFAGMVRRESVALDWCHDADEIIGVADRFDTASGELFVGGSIESLEPLDAADKLIRLSDRGVPFEASIYFDPYALVLEWIPEGFSAEANGRTYEGPLTIARQWQLRRIAITPSGVDAGTRATFSAEESVGQFSLTWKDQAMTKSAPAAPETPATPATEMSAEQLAAVRDAERAKFAAELNRYQDKFGPVDGAEYFSAGLNWEAALEKALEKVTAAQLSAEAAAKAHADRLAAVNLGESTAVDTRSPGGNADDATPAGKTSFSACFKAATMKAAPKAGQS
jgi:hypothetical protein